MNKENKKIEIDLEEYKELIETKGKYEELKEHPEIRYIHIYDYKPYVDMTPKITW